MFEYVEDFLEDAIACLMAMHVIKSLKVIYIDREERKPRFCKDGSRKIDPIARYGGEEFGIILPLTKKEEALILAERIRKAVETNRGLKNITISIGMASFPENGDTKENLIAKADKALYEAKKLGKNRICV